MPDNLFTPDKLQAKLGKLPVWAWGIIGGTVVLGGYYFSKARKNARDPNAAANTPATDNLASVFTGMATPGQTDNATLPVDGYSGGTISTGDNALGDANLETNVTWLNRGIKVATSQGKSSLSSTTALQKYLQGKPVTNEEADIVNIVLSALGYPPEGSPLLVKAIQDTVTTKPNTTKPVVTPKPVTTTKTVTTPTPVVNATKLGPNGYPLDNKGKEIIQYSSTIPLEILNGKFQGNQVNLNYKPDKFTYVKVDNTIPGSPTH